MAAARKAITFVRQRGYHEATGELLPGPRGGGEMPVNPTAPSTHIGGGEGRRKLSLGGTARGQPAGGALRPTGVVRGRKLGPKFKILL